MSTSVTLPALGESVTEGTVSRWLKQVGDTVAADEPLLEVSTDKVDTEIPSPSAGVLLEIRAQEDETVEVGAVLAVIGEASEAESGGDAEPAGDVDTSSEQASAPSAEPEPTDEGEAPKPIEESKAPTSESTKGASGAGGTEVTLPALGESVTEGTVSRWLKKVGDKVDADEPLLEVSTDKVDTEIPSPAGGTLLEIRVQEDETVEVGAVLAVVGEESAAGSSSDGADSPPVEAAPAPVEAAPAPVEAASEETATVSSGDTIEEQAAAGDEGGQAPIPAPEPDGQAEPPAQAEATAQAEANAQAEPVQQAEEPAPAEAQDAQPTPQSSAGTTSSSGTKAGPDSDAGYVTPLVRKLAKEHGVDLASLSGTGVGGRVRKQDVLAAAEAARQAAEDAKQAAATPAPAPAPAAAPAAAASAPAPAAESSNLRGTTEKMSRLRRTIAKRMVESLQVSAQLTTVVEVDLTNVSRLRARVKNDFLAAEGVKLSYLPFLVKAAIEALKIHPKVNATIDTDAGEITYPATENVAIAVDTEKGLLVPVIRDAGDLSIAGIAKKIADLAARTRSNKLSPDDLAGGTFTVTNTGSRGALFDTPIINQPQVAILGTGALVKRPVVINDPKLGEVIAVRDMMYLALSYDHRLVDGADAARFLATLKARLEEGDFDV